jgi:hypothetical protein
VPLWTSLATWVTPAAIVCALTVGFVLSNLPGLSGDTVALVHGAHTIAYCLSHGIHSYCDRLPRFVPGSASIIARHGIVEGAVAPYALLQYLPALLLTQLGMSDGHVYSAFSIISAASLCALVGLSATTAARTRRPWAAPAAALMVTTSPLIFYAWSTFGESLAALLIALFTVAALRRWPGWVLLLLGVLACLTKETVFPIVVVLGAVSLYATPVGSRPLVRGHWVGLACGAVLGIVVSADFDWFRYGQLTNYTYGHSFEQVPGAARRLGLSVALWIAPNGGVAWFWLLAAVGSLGIVVIAVVHTRRGPRFRRTAVPAIGLVLVLLFLTGTLASWYAPFGWVAWGPRLMLPVLPSVLLIALVVYASDIERALRALLAGMVGRIAVATVVILVALPQVNVLHANQVIGEPFLTDATCPSPPSPTTTAYYYRCLDHYAWGRPIAVAKSFQAFDNTGGVLFGLAFAAAWGRLVWLIGAGLRTQRPDREAEAVVSGASTQR